MSTAHWHWPQVAMVGLIGFELIVTAIAHGSPRKPFDFRVAVLGNAIYATLLIAGGFFR